MTSNAIILKNDYKLKRFFLRIFWSIPTAQVAAVIYQSSHSLMALVTNRHGDTGLNKKCRGRLIVDNKGQP